MGKGSEEELAVALAHMSRDLLMQDTVQQTLDRIVDHAVALVDGCEFAGILTLHGKHGEDQHRRVETLAVTNDLARQSDQFQAELDEGPCVDAAKDSTQVYRIADMTKTQQRWPRYAPKAHQLGVGSMMGFLLYTEEDAFGALDLYATGPNTFTDRSELVGWLLASHAAVAFSSARLGAQLHSAVASRQHIGEALGVVMERYKITEDQAFDVIKTSSQHRNVKLRDIAEHINTTGEVPGPR